jgi:hypothetical protein
MLVDNGTLFISDGEEGRREGRDGWMDDPEHPGRRERRVGG